MRDELQNLFDKYPTTFAQVLKSSKNKILYDWFMQESTDVESDSLRGRAYIFLNNIDMLCPLGNSKKWSQNKLRFCNIASACECASKFLSDNSKNTTQFSTQEFKDAQAARWEEHGNPLMLPENIQKRKDAISNRSVEQKEERNKQYLDSGFDQVILRLKDYVIPLFTKDDYLGSFRKNEYLWECVKCNSTVLGHVDYGTIPKCAKCYPKSTSNGERELTDYIENLGFDDLVLRSKKYIPPQELDIFIPSKNIAFEYNGVYWHSTLKKDKFYHVDKFLECKKKGIHLIQIFENEWINKPDIIKNRISAILGKCNRIYARNTTVSKISNKLAKDFIVTHHLRGYAAAKLSYGLHYNNELVAVMSFGVPRYAKKAGAWELIRFCSKNQIVGGASKLLAAFTSENVYTEIISYADRCWSDGNVYRNIGFVDVTADQRNLGYWYTNGIDRIHRSSLTHKKLVDMGYDSALTADEIIDSKLGYLKIYDCGNYTFKIDTSIK